MITALFYGFLTVIGFIALLWLIGFAVEWLEYAEAWKKWAASVLFFSVFLGFMYYSAGVR